MTFPALAVHHGECNGWPVPLPIGSGDPPAFPVETLPGPGRKMVEHVAKTVQTDPALPAAALLGCYAIALQGWCTITGMSLTEETALWCVPVAGVSEGKSSAFSPMLAPVFEHEKILRDQAESVSDGDEKSLPVLVMEDHTVEVLGMMMSRNGNRMALVSAEPIVFQQMEGSRDRKPTLDSYLKAYSGETVKVHRIGRENQTMYRALLTILVAAQPDAVKGFLQNERLGGRGVFSRLLYFPCRSLAGTRTLQPAMNPDIIRRYREHILSMLSNTRERRLFLSEDAQSLFQIHYDSIERMQAPGGDFENNPWARKQQGRALRLAALLHCAEGEQDEIVSDKVMSRAVALSDYFIESALFIAEKIGESKETANLQKILSWCLEQKKPSLTFREIHNFTRKKTQVDSECTRKYMHILEELGHVRRIPESKAESYMLSPYHQKGLKLYTHYDT